MRLALTFRCWPGPPSQSAPLFEERAPAGFVPCRGLLLPPALLALAACEYPAPHRTKTPTGLRPGI
jgi:hypothetical protein